LEGLIHLTEFEKKTLTASNWIQLFSQI
jgi:hypothetical protein